MSLFLPGRLHSDAASFPCIWMNRYQRRSYGLYQGYRITSYNVCYTKLLREKTVYAYNKAARAYEEKFSRNETYKKHALFFADQFEPGDDILDIGCGPGLNSALFTGKGLNVTGVDYYWRVQCTDGYESSGWSDLELFDLTASATINIPGDYSTISQALASALRITSYNVCYTKLLRTERR